MAERRLELFEEYRETGFDGQYERTTYYRLIVDEGKVILEVEVEKRTSGGSTNTSTTRHEIGVNDLVKLIEKHGTRVSS